MAASYEGDGVDAHIEAAFVGEEEVADCGGAQAEGDGGEDAIQGAEREQFAVAARGPGPRGHGDAADDGDYVNGPAAVDVGDGVPEEGGGAGEDDEDAGDIGCLGERLV